MRNEDTSNPTWKACAEPDWNQFLNATDPVGAVASEALSGKCILITGAGGSIGSALALAAWTSQPGTLVLLDTSENGLYEIDRALHAAGSQAHISVLGSVCDGDGLADLFERYQPQIVLHAAALKHVPLMERNPFAAVENNALGTYTLARAAVGHGAESLVLASTDKAVDPASIMGASKRIAELVLLALGSSHTRMTAVRLCNVIGSQGSVLPLFLEQIAAGGPLTVTDPDARRYFITVHRAVECIFEAVESPLEASILAGDPGPAMRIVELAKHLIRTHASTATLTFTGLRPGDKLSESLLSSREEFRAASRAGGSLLRVVESPLPGRSAVCAGLEELQSAVQTRDMERLLRGVLALVPEYRPSAVIDAALAESGFREVTAEMHA